MSRTQRWRPDRQVVSQFAGTEQPPPHPGREHQGQERNEQNQCLPVLEQPKCAPGSVNYHVRIPPERQASQQTLSPLRCQCRHFLLPDLSVRCQRPVGRGPCAAVALVDPMKPENCSYPRRLSGYCEQESFRRREGSCSDPGAFPMDRWLLDCWSRGENWTRPGPTQLVPDDPGRTLLMEGQDSLPIVRAQVAEINRKTHRIRVRNWPTSSRVGESP